MRSASPPLLSLLGAAALASGGCGSSAHSASTQPATARTAVAPTTPGTQGSRAAHREPAPHPQRAQHRAPAPAGPPPPPAGLRATTGFASYELCSGACSGSVPVSLRRPLRTPTSCAPRSGGPVTPQPATLLATTPFIGSDWRGVRVTWTASRYSGPILIRGRQVGGSGAVGFGEGHVPYDELQLQGTGPWQTFTRVRSPGCFFYQVDGTSFSTTIVFRAS